MLIRFVTFCLLILLFSFLWLIHFCIHHYRALGLSSCIHTARDIHNVSNNHRSHGLSLLTFFLRDDHFLYEHSVLSIIYTKICNFRLDLNDRLNKKAIVLEKHVRKESENDKRTANTC